MPKWTGKFHEGDCLQLMARLPPESLSCIVTSPPYNLRTGTGSMGKPGTGGKWSGSVLRQGYGDYADSMVYADYIVWQRQCLQAMLRLLKSDGVIFYNHKWRIQKGLLEDRSDIVQGFPVRQILIWERAGGLNFNPGYFLPTYEVVYMICKPAFKLRQEYLSLGDVWKITQELKNPHPAPFPVELARRLIAATTAPIILDPFMGSGTTALAAEQCGRKWIGFDLSPDYCQMAEARLRERR